MANTVLFRGAFIRKVVVEVSFEDGLWLYRSNKLGLLSFGSTRADAKVSFAEDFEMMWDHVASSSDNELAEDALRVKTELLKTVVPSLIL